jgi:RHS repeat-associated protein
VPVALLGNPSKIKFVIVSTMPGASSYLISPVCDVLPGGKKSIDEQMLTMVNEYTMPLAPGTSRTTVTAEGYLYDNEGNLMADLDSTGNMAKRYIYGLGGKSLAMQTNASLYGPYNNACEDTAGIFRGGDSSPLTFATEGGDKMQGLASMRVKVGDTSNNGSFWMPDWTISFSSAVYRYVHIWVKPLAGAQWLKFTITDDSAKTWKAMTGDKDGDMLFEVGEDLAVGQWNELWIDLNKNNKGWIDTYVRGFNIQNNNNSEWLIDGIYTCSRGWNTYYYHTDYLNSPRAMTNTDGTVIWRQDYYAFGSDFMHTATGNTHKFTGHVKDDVTGQYYAKARYFTTQLGRWSQPEPLLKGVPGASFLSNPQKLNPYVYCANNPTKYSDPDGKDLIGGQYRSSDNTTIEFYDPETGDNFFFDVSEPAAPGGEKDQQLAPGDYELKPRQESGNVIKKGDPVYTTPGQNTGVVITPSGKQRGAPDGPIGPHVGSVSLGCPLFPKTEEGRKAKEGFVMLMKMNYNAGGVKLTIKESNKDNSDELMKQFAERVRTRISNE